MLIRRDVGRIHDREAGVTFVETLVATLLVLITSLGLMGMLVTAIAMNNRNKIGSTGTMLAQAVVEQIKATIIGSGSSALTDCAGTTWTIDTVAGAGAAVNNSAIDFTQTSPPTNYHMNYVVKSPCTSTGGQARTYDVRWNVEIVGGAPGASNTYMITVGARLLTNNTSKLIFPDPVNFRVMAGN
jgi:Tfp pilus assembly protein PilV